MTTRLTLRAAVVAAALATVSSAAQAQSPLHVGLAGGLTPAVGTSSDIAGAGYHGMVTLGVRAPLLPVGFRVDGMYNQLVGKDFGSLLGSAPDMRVATANANLTFDVLPLPVVRPYVIGGAGYYRVSFRDVEGSESRMGYNGGAGLRLSLSGFSAFLEGRYHRVNMGDNSKVEMVPVTFGVMF